MTRNGTMLGGRDSQFGLKVRLPYDFGLDIGAVDAPGDRYVFAGGTSVEGGGYLFVAPANTLVSDVVVDEFSSFYLDGNLEGNLLVEERNADRPAGEARLLGHVTGNVTNAGDLKFFGRVDGNVENSGRMTVQGVGTPGVLLNGNFTQSSSGTFVFQLAPGDPRFSPAPFQITGRADLAGTLELGLYDDWSGDSYPIPVTGTYQIVHAGDGVFGTFAQWTSPGLFVEGNVRYGSNDVWFDLTRLSVLATMATSASSNPLTLASAANLDNVLARTDRFATLPPHALTVAQRNLLVSVGSIMRIADFKQAARSLDSLSGAAHADALRASLQGGVTDRALEQRLATMQPGLAAGAWAQDRADGSSVGYDQWLGSRLLAGTSVGQGTGSAREAFGKLSEQPSPHASAYLRWFGDQGWYGGGSVGFARQTLTLDRAIDLGVAGQWNANTEHHFDVGSVQAELGRRIPLADGMLTPYVAVAATAVHSQHVNEQGGTGLELMLKPSHQSQVNGDLGLRFGREWRFEGGWLRLDADARWSRSLAHAGDAMRAAYTGMPDMWFDLPGDIATSSGWLDLGVQGMFGHRWTWSLDASRQFASIHQPTQAWRLGLQRAF